MSLLGLLFENEKERIIERIKDELPQDQSQGFGKILSKLEPPKTLGKWMIILADSQPLKVHRDGLIHQNEKFQVVQI